MGLGSQHPKTPIYLQINVALLVRQQVSITQSIPLTLLQATWAVHTANSDGRNVFQFESFNLDAHRFWIVNLWTSPDTFPDFARMEDLWIVKGGSFHD